MLWQDIPARRPHLSCLGPEWRNGSSRLAGGVPWAHHLRISGHEKGQDVETLRDGRTRG